MRVVLFILLTGWPLATVANPIISEVLFSKSSDKGMNWSGTVEIGGTAVLDDPPPLDASVGIYGVYATAWASSSPPAIFVAISDDQGSTWSSPNVRVDDGSSGRKVRPTVRVDALNNVYVAWEDYRHTSPSIYFAKSTDPGASWTSPSIEISALPSAEYGFPSLDLDRGGNICIVWQLHGQFSPGVSETVFDSAVQTALNVYPNPSTGSFALSYALPHSARIQLGIYDLSGRLVREISSGDRTPGFYAVHWDGRDSSGNAVKRGVYLCRLEFDSVAVAKKMVLL